MEFNYEKFYVDNKTGFMFRYIFSETEIMVEHWHDYFEIFLILEGEIIHHVNGISQRLTEGAFVFIRPGDVHKYECHNGQVRFLNLAVSKTTMSRLIEYLGSAFNKDFLIGGVFPPTVMLSKEKSNDILRKFQQINTFEKADTVRYKLHMRAYLCEIMFSCFLDANINRDEAEEVPKWLSGLCEKMYEKNNFVAGTDRMVELSGKSREHLAKSVKKYLGVTLSEYICNLRLNYASNMLLNSNMNVADLCYDCGFDNTSYFFRKFKERYGLSPIAYRKQAHSDQINGN